MKKKNINNISNHNQNNYNLIQNHYYNKSKNNNTLPPTKSPNKISFIRYE